MAERVPALIVSGFLGSGKTTLVRALLEDAQRTGVRLAVVSNEFGELGIDRELLGVTGEAYVELDGGCVCCQLSDELVTTLQQLWERVRPDRIVVETSGIALPYDTQLCFEREPVASWAGEDLAAVVVNADQLATGRDLAGTFEDQVSSADLLLLNKIDLVPKASLDGLERQLQALAPGTPVIRCVRAQIDPRILFTPAPRAGREPGPRPHAHAHQHDAFQVEERTLEATADLEALRTRIQDWGALRVKGFVQTNDGVVLIQGVGPRVEISPAEKPVPTELVGRLVVIRSA